MSVIARFVICILIEGWYLTVSSTDFVESTWEERSVVMPTLAPMISEWSETSLSCVLTCRHHLTCMSAIFISSTSKCLGYNHDVTKTDDGWGDANLQKAWIKLCRDGFSRLENSTTCVKMYNADLLNGGTWIDAREYCGALHRGSSLLELINEEEFHIFTNHLTSSSESETFIGLQKLHSGGSSFYRFILSGLILDTSSLWAEVEEAEGDMDTTMTKCVLLKKTAFFKFKLEKCDMNRKGQFSYFFCYDM